MSLSNQHRQYLKTQIVTASKEQLVLMLYDGILRFSEQGRQGLLRGEIDIAHTAFMRTQAIIMELVYTLNREDGGEIASNLARLYAYAFNALIQANLKHDTAKIDEVQNIFRGIREGWIGAMQRMGVETPPEAIPQPEIRTASDTPATYGASRTATIRQPFAPPPTRAAAMAPPESEPRVTLNFQG